jgi:hypothetical protein
MRVDPVAERGHGHALLPPLVRAQDTEQFGERDGHGPAWRSVGLLAGLADVRGATQVEFVVVADEDEQPSHEAGAMGAMLPVAVEDLGRGELLRGGPLHDAPVDRAQQLPGVLVVAAPEQGGTAADKAEGGVGFHAVVGDRDL